MMGCRNKGTLIIPTAQWSDISLFRQNQERVSLLRHPIIPTSHEQVTFGLDPRLSWRLQNVQKS